MAFEFRDRLATLLHSGALLLFGLAAVLYQLSSSALVFGLLGVIFEIIAWIRWLTSKTPGGYRH